MRTNNVLIRGTFRTGRRRPSGLARAATAPIEFDPILPDHDFAIITYGCSEPQGAADQCSPSGGLKPDISGHIGMAGTCMSLITFQGVDWITPP